ncbi:MAG: cation transporter [Blautia sp.]|nr:cation transporter [Blautia sp.]
MIYVIYLILAAGVVYLSNKASEYVDLLDKKTSLSGAFIGGVMLSAVTSLPELFTSLTSTLLLDKPGLCIGNILGSDLFNIMTLSILILVFYQSFLQTRIANSHIIVTIAVMLMYVTLLLNKMHVLDFEVATINFASFIIIGLYVWGVKNMAEEDGSESQEEVESALTVKQIVIRFVLVSIGIIGLSIAITYATDLIAQKLNLGTGLAGALFLGVATSLPEVSSTIALFRMKNYNIAIGNIIGSNLFNYIILAVADILYLGKGVYDYSDPKSLNLLVYGAIATPLMLVLFKWKNKFTQVMCPIGVIICYVLFLAL